MPGESTVIHLPFAGGLDEKVAKEYLDASARQSYILNGDFSKLGSIDKRRGMKHLPTPLIPGGDLPALESGTRVVGWSRSSLSVLCSTGLYQHVLTPVGGASEGGVVGVASLPAVEALRRPLPTGGTPAPPVLCDINYEGALLRLILAYDEQYNIVASVYDANSGDVILDQERIYTATGTLALGTIPYVVAAFDLPDVTPGYPRTVVVIHDRDTRAVHYVQYRPELNSFDGPFTLISAPCFFVDAAPYEGDPEGGWLVLYDVGGSAPSTPGTTVRLAYWRPVSGLHSLADQAIGSGNTLYAGMYVCGKYGQSVWSTWTVTNPSGGGNTWFYAQRRAADNTYTFSASSSPTVIDFRGGVEGWFLNGVVHLGTDKILTTYTYDRSDLYASNSTYMSAWRVMYYNGAGTITSWSWGKIPLGLLPATRPFLQDGEVYCPYYYNLKYTNSPDDPCKQITLYLCKFEGVADDMAYNVSPTLTDVCRPVATVAPRQTAHAFQAAIDFITAFHVGHSSGVYTDSGRQAVGIKTVGPQGGSTAAEMSGPAWAADFTFDSSEIYQASELGSELSISGGVPFVADGRTAFEDGFFNYPEYSYAAAEGSATPLDTGDYTFAVVYRAIDSAGLVHRSAPYITAPLSITIGGAGPVVYITPPLASYRDFGASATTPGKVFADVYMTTKDGGTLYYKGSIPVSNDTTWATEIRYPATGQITSEPDTEAPLLYTTGGVMDNVNPPASTVQITHQGRKVLIDETRRGMWPSKQFTEGQAPGFNEALYIPLPEDGDVVELASLESRLIIFKRTSIWVMAGEGPAVTGQGSTWTTPERISSDVGCKSWRSVIQTPFGVMFQAPNNGIYLLGNDLSVSFIGRNVTDTTNQYPVVASAVLAPFSSQVRFICTDEAKTNHIVVVYDYVAQAWTTHRYDHFSAIPVSACVSEDYGYSVLTADGQLWQERSASDPELYLDEDDEGDTHFVPTSVTTPFVKLQVQGFHRARRVQFLGEQSDDCGLQLQFAFNYNDTVRQTANWSSTQLAALKNPGQVETYVGRAYNKQMALQVTVTDTAGSSMTSGAGMRFSSLAIELQNLGPRYKLLSAGARR